SGDEQHGDDSAHRPAGRGRRIARFWVGRGRLHHQAVQPHGSGGPAEAVSVEEALKKLLTVHLPRALRIAKTARSIAITKWTEFRQTGLERAVILLKAMLVMVVFLYPVWWLHRNVVSSRVPQIPLSLA